MTKKTIVIVTALVALAVFGVAGFLYKKTAVETAATEEAPKADMTTLVRPHSPVIGPENAPVTVVEFFDPSCESCRAAYPFVKQLIGQYPQDVRLVLRYAAFHEGSDQAVGILEAARLQNLFVPVLEALLEHQPEWAIHGAPNLDKAWEFAGKAGLDVAKAKEDAKGSAVAVVLAQDNADLQANNVHGTPTFFIDGEKLAELGAKPFAEAISAALAKAKK